MKKCHLYYAVEPLLPEYRDDGNIRPLFTVPVKTPSKTYEVALFGTDQHVYMIRIMVPDLEEGEEGQIPEADWRVVYALKEHMVSVLRITFDHDVSLYPRNFWNFIDMDGEPSLHIEIREVINPDYKLNGENIRNVFVNTSAARNEIKLFSDAQDERIPLQYRYLSLYKILELEFMGKSGWRQPDFSRFMGGFRVEFDTLGLGQRKLEGYVRDLRNRCAHLRRGMALFGVTMLNNKDAAEVERFLPLMTKICATILNTKYEGKFRLATTPPPSDHHNS